MFCTWAGILNASQTFSATVSTVRHASDGEAVEVSAREVLHERVLKFTKFVENAHAVLTRGCRSVILVKEVEMYGCKKKNSNLLRRTHCANQ